MFFCLEFYISIDRLSTAAGAKRNTTELQLIISRAELSMKGWTRGEVNCLFNFKTKTN